jgi:hypothetical protein
MPDNPYPYDQIKAAALAATKSALKLSAVAGGFCLLPSGGVYYATSSFRAAAGAMLIGSLSLRAAQALSPKLSRWTQKHMNSLRYFNKLVKDNRM